MEPNQVPPPQPGKTWHIRNNAHMVQYMCTMCQITPEHYYRRLEALEAYERDNEAIAARIMARHGAQIKPKETPEQYAAWVAKKAKQNTKRKR